jgi:hypothetical protein
MSNAINEIDPVRDPRWAQLVMRHHDASLFHTVEWLEALRRTYGYEQLVLTTSSPSAPLAGCGKTQFVAVNARGPAAM